MPRVHSKNYITLKTILLITEINFVVRFIGLQGALEKSGSFAM